MNICRKIQIRCDYEFIETDEETDENFQKSICVTK